MQHGAARVRRDIDHDRLRIALRRQAHRHNRAVEYVNALSNGELVLHRAAACAVVKQQRRLVQMEHIRALAVRLHNEACHRAGLLIPDDLLNGAVIQVALGEDLGGLLRGDAVADRRIGGCRRVCCRQVCGESRTREQDRAAQDGSSRSL